MSTLMSDLLTHTGIAGQMETKVAHSGLSGIAISPETITSADPALLGNAVNEGRTLLQDIAQNGLVQALTKKIPELAGIYILGSAATQVTTGSSPLQLVHAALTGKKSRKKKVKHVHTHRVRSKKK